MSNLTIGKRVGKQSGKEFFADFHIAKQYDAPAAKVAKSADAEDGTFIVEGYASTSDVDSQYSIIRQAALDQGAKSLQKYTTLLFNHDMNRPIGKILMAEARPNKLFVKCSVSKTETDIRAKIQDGTLSKFSIMGEILDYDHEAIDGEDIMIIKSMRLFEVSLVSVPANAEAKTLNWYIEKSMGVKSATLSKAQQAKPKWDDDEEEDEKAGGKNKQSEKKAMDTSEGEFVAACDECLGAMETVAAGVTGEDKDNAVRYVQWLQAMKESYDTADANEQEASSGAKKSAEDQSVKKKASEKDYVTVLQDETPEAPEQDGEQTAVKSMNQDDEEIVVPAAEAVAEEVVEEAVATEAVTVEKAAAVEAVEKVEKAVVQPAVAASDDANLVKSLASVVAEIKELAKGVVAAVDETQKAKSETEALKGEVQKALEELRETLKGVPVRKSTPVAETAEAEQRLEDGVIEKGRRPKSSIDRARERVKGYDNLPPLDRLRVVMQEQLGAEE